MEFKSGDRVRYTGTKEMYEWEVGNLTTRSLNIDGERIWNLEFERVWLQEMQVRESEIELLYRKPDTHRYCQCGAHAVRGQENLHSDWCPMYRNKNY